MNLPITNQHDSDIDPNELALQLLRSNFPSFIQQSFATLNPGTPYSSNWHIIAIAHHLEQVRLGKVKRLIITMPPRSLKSISASVAFPAYIHGKDPSSNVIAVSYGQDLAVKLHNDYRKVVNSDWYQQAFPNTTVSSTKDSETETAFDGGGFRLATSIGGTLTGRGADIIIIDDPLKPSDAMSEPKRSQVNEWFGTTLTSRLNNKHDGAIIIVTQRVHADDLVGHVLEKAPDDWEVLNLPAIATETQNIPIGENTFYTRQSGDLLHPSREGQSVLDTLRRDIGSDGFEAQYQQCPVPPGGFMFKREWIKRYDHPPYSIESEHKIIQSWDTASKTGPANDWSVCTTWLVHDNTYYLLDVYRQKLDYPSLRAQAIELAKSKNPHMIIVEDTGVGTGLIADLRQAGFNIKEFKPTEPKEVRASLQSAKFEGGRVMLPEKASWLSEFEAELFSFPGGRHDDQVDSVVQALAYEIRRPGIAIWAGNLKTRGCCGN